jgi:streptogramin lyase
LGLIKSFPVNLPQDLAVAANSVWTTSEATDSVIRIDPFDAGVTTIQVEPGLGPQEIEAVGETIFAGGEGGVVRINPEDVSVEPIPGTEGLSHVTYAFESVWAAGDGGYVLRIDPGTLETIARIHVTGDGFCGAVNYGLGSMWLGCGDVTDRIDPETNEIISSGDVGAPIEAGGRMWSVSGATPYDVASAAQAYGQIDEVDPTNLHEIAGTTIPLVSGAGPTRMALDGDIVWLPTSFGLPSGAGLLFAFDGREGRVLQAFDLSEGRGYGSNAIAFAFGSLWAASGNGNAVRRFQTPTL